MATSNPGAVSSASAVAASLGATFAHAGVGLCEIDADGRFVRVNRTLCSLLGRSEQILSTLRVSDVTHPDDIDASAALIRGVAGDGVPRSIDKRYCLAGGHTVWARSTATRLPGLPGQRVSLLLVTVDLTDRRRAEQALLESEQRARTLIKGIAQATWELDSDGTARGDAASWHALTGQDAAARAGDGWLDVIHPDDREGARIGWQATLAAGGVFNVDVRLRRLTGGYVWTNLRAGPVRDAGGACCKWVGMSIDISARKTAEAARYASESRLHSLVNGIPQLVWRAREDGRWTWSSPQWQAMTGEGASAALGFGWLDAVHPDDRASTLARWSEAMRTGVFEVEHRLSNPGLRRYAWFQTRASPVRLDDGSIVEWLGTSTDVDDLRRLQEGQRILVAELQHRTRNLLGLVSAIAGRTMDDSLDFDDFRERFNIRLDALARVQSALSRLDESEPVALDGLITDELSAHGVAPGHGITLDGPPNLNLRLQSIQPLAMALHELTTNAVKYGALGGQGRLAIRWWLAPEDDSGDRMLHIEWRESGVTIPAPDAGRRPAGQGGQGRELIERALPYQLQARTRFDLTGDGLHCAIVLPAARVLED